MAFDEGLAERVRAILAKRPDVAERRMFGGLTFMVAGRMCCGVHGDELILRLDPGGAERALEDPQVRRMDLTGRRMRGFVMVEPGRLAGKALRRWVEQAVAHAAQAAEGG